MCGTASDPLLHSICCAPSGDPRATFVFGNRTQTDGQMYEEGHGRTHTHAPDVAQSLSPPQGKIALRQKSLPRGKELGSWGDTSNAS